MLLNNQKQNKMKKLKIEFTGNLKEHDLTEVFNSVAYLNRVETSATTNAALSEREKLNILHSDCKILLANKPLKFGQGGSHVWISTLDNNRIAAIYFN